MKIAVPVYEDGLRVYRRTGRAPYFAIFENEDFSELRKNIHAYAHEKIEIKQLDGQIKKVEAKEEYSQKEIEKHKKDFALLQDCDIILAMALGKNLTQALALLELKTAKINNKENKIAKQVVDNFLKNAPELG